MGMIYPLAAYPIMDLQVIPKHRSKFLPIEGGHKLRRNVKVVGEQQTASVTISHDELSLATKVNAYKVPPG